MPTDHFYQHLSTCPTSVSTLSWLPGPVVHVQWAQGRWAVPLLCFQASQSASKPVSHLRTSHPDRVSAQLSPQATVHTVCFRPNASASDPLSATVLLSCTCAEPLSRCPSLTVATQAAASACLSPLKGGCAPLPHCNLLRHEHVISQKAPGGF